MRPPVEPLNDGREAWRLGFSGFFMHLRGIVSTLLITVLTATGVPWWWNASIPLTFEVNLKFLAAFFFIFIGVFAISSFIYLRNRSIRSLQIKYLLHQLSHSIRDEQTRINEKSKPNGNFSNSELTKELEHFLRDMCENIQKYFSMLTNDKTVEIAMRLAVLKESKVVYRTYARSKGLNPNRSKESEDIAINEGLPRFLRSDHNALGVIIYNDFIEAEKIGAYKVTKNDRKFPDEIKTAMVAPMNAWDGEKQDMIGILFVTSKNKNTFSAKHVDSVAFISDMTASAISSTINTAKSGRLITIEK